jgi:hypothetical protein
MAAMKKTRRYFFISLMLLIGSIVAFYLIRFTVYIYTSMQQISARAVEQSDYTKITTPLPTGVAHDLCVEFEISLTDRRCKSGAVVYGPDFFPDLKSYFLALPKQDATYQTVEDKLAAYKISCEKPNNEGHYRCKYDIRGDGIYPIFIYFTKEGFYYRIIANTSSS